MRKNTIYMILFFLIFFGGTCCLIAIDNICNETTGYGGKLVLDVEKLGLFN